MILGMRVRILFSVAILGIASVATAAERKTKNVIFVMTDGLRWQEVFNGADPELMNKDNGAVTDIPALRASYWRDDPQARREALMPFVWSVVAKNGQVYGNRSLGSDAHVTNTMFFSYPGYNETLSGAADDARITSNDKNPNPNVTVLEWLHRKPAYRGKVAAFAAWDTFPAIFNAARAGFPVNAGYEPFEMTPLTDRLKLLNRLKVETPAWKAEPFDSFTFHTALEYVKRHKPRVLFLSLGETDEWSHEGKYTEYLHSANRVDRYLKELWETVQSIPQYRGTTTLIFSPDHGRGGAPVAWRSHGQKVPDSKYIWMAFLGPDTRPLGERSKVSPVTQNQIAATLAAFLGEDYTADVPNAGKPIANVLAQ
jgi:hypothetical protein